MSALGAHVIVSVLNVPVADVVVTVAQELADMALVVSADVPLAIVFVEDAATSGENSNTENVPPDPFVVSTLPSTIPDTGKVEPESWQSPAVELEI